MKASLAKKGAPIPERLQQARLAKGLSQPELAFLLGLDLTRQSISQYERGTHAPKPEVVEAIHEKLGFPVDFFYKEIAYRRANPIFFRRYKTAKAKIQGILETKVLWVGESLSYLRNFLDFPKFNVFKLTKKRKEYTQEEIEAIAVDVRKHWGLGLNPISDLILLLENNGFIITKFKFGRKELDACSTRYLQDGEERPLICLSGDKTSVRSRFDAAHELGHMVLHSWFDDNDASDKDNHERMEQEANYFAGAFLMPRETFLKEAHSLTSIDSYVYLKKRWKVSIAALIQRYKNLGVLRDSQYQYLQRQISFRGFRKEEPLDDVIKHEEPQVFSKSIRLLVENNIQSVDEIRTALPFENEDLTMILGIDLSIYEKKKGPNLRLICS